MPSAPFGDITAGKHLLFDNTSIGDTYRLKRRVHQPRRDPTEPVLTVEQPWEGDYVTPLRVECDATERYRMWYQVHDYKIEAERKALGTSTHGNVGEPQPLFTCFAQSNDGVRWERPTLDVYPPTNICFKGHSYSGGNTIMFQPEAPADRRYLLVNCDWKTEMEGGIYIAASADGIHWRYINEKPLVFGESDTWNCLVYNAERGVYMLYMRGWHCAAVAWPQMGKDNARRRVAYSESRDLVTWSEPQVILTPDELDTNDFYGLQVFRYADYYLGYLWIYDDDERDTIEIELVWSHDGIRWSRLPHRPAFIPRGRPGDPDGYMIIPAQEPVVVGDNIYIYYTGHGTPHHLENPYSAAYRSRLRLDGFLSLAADLPWAGLITRPFVVGSGIEINAATHGGEIIAELVEPYYHEPEGKPIAGFTAADCDVFRGDAVHHRLSWRGSDDLTALRGRRVMLRMAMRHAEIYSFTV